MLEPQKNDNMPFRCEVLTLDWYPSDRSYRIYGIKPVRPKRVPPLMVRKAEWRR